MPVATYAAHPGHAALRRGRRELAGQTYLLTTVTARRCRWFARPLVATAAAREIGGGRLWRDNRVHAWVLMPDHLHVLLTLDGRESLAHVMNRVKSVTARAAHDAGASGKPMWAAAFHDHALRREEDVVKAARYVIANPVRAGLASDIWGWPWWDCEWLPDLAGDLAIAGVDGRAFRPSYRRYSAKPW